MKTLTKAELSEGLMQDFGLKRSLATAVVDTIFEEIRLVLESGQSVKVSGFGKFMVRQKRARPGRNPKTGEAKTIAARAVVTFKATQALRAKVQDS